MSQRKTPGQTPTVPGRTPKRPAPTGGPVIGKRMPDKRTPPPVSVPGRAPKRPAPKGGPITSPQRKTSGIAAANNALNKAASKIKSQRATSLGASTSKRTPLDQAAMAVKARARGR
jgi:hypothetical protein